MVSLEELRRKVLSALLYLLYFPGITNGKGRLVKISEYPDDIAVIVKYKSEKWVRRHLDETVASIDLVLRDIKLDLSPSKTVFIDFSRRGVKPGATEVKVRDRIIRSSKSVQFLGVVFDYKMDFDKQDFVRKKCSRAIILIRF